LVLTSTQDLVSLGRRLNLQPPVVDFRQVGDLEGRELSTAEAQGEQRPVPDIEQAAAGAGGQHLADDVRRSPASSLLM
jgi:hypothetical protein